VPSGAAVPILKHPRCVARVFVSTREVSIGACFGEGTYLNDLLVTEGYARIVG